MLKFTFTETGFYLELLPESLESWLPPRLTLMLKAGQSITLERCSASFVLAASTRCRRELAALMRLEDEGAIAVSPCDAETLEVSLRGTWLTSRKDLPEGVFLATLTPPTEAMLYNLWQQEARQNHIGAQG
ncbi:alr0857 family protein [Leptolyngbya sp. FACHB-16]|uniref:alr0857 family protein n=1 Tax=unclassified Leptolyngbya TaxID=2650499 RepID=UPI0016875DCF|nr:alr0857 family protein [Leptolyngbya sp. FACHB-16]MBD2157912.1 hypothetical protein [Leptolyngbya sp. FACHB-16]